MRYLNCAKCWLVVVAFGFATGGQPDVVAAADQSESGGDKSPLIEVPGGFIVQRVAGPPLVEHPMMAGFDERGRLFVAESAGLNLQTNDLEEQLPNSIRLLEDSDGDGVFDKATTFADKMTFPMGAVWYRDALFVASPPCIWKLQDGDGDGIADRREVLAGRFGYTGNAADVHGCFLSPEGRIFWCDGRHGHEFRDEEGEVVSQGDGSYIFSCWPDGSDLRAHCGGGMDNPVEVDFLPTGDVIGTVNIMYRNPRIDCLVHWLHGGAYPHLEKVLGEFKKTGELLGSIHDFGHVAVSGLTRSRGPMFPRGPTEQILVSIFNTGKVLRCEVEPSGSTYRTRQFEFLSCSDPNFHPTDILEDADGSLLVIDTGGWFRIGCPTSQIAKPEFTGGIYRIRRIDLDPPRDPRGLTIGWKRLGPAALAALLSDPRPAVRERAIDECAQREDAIVPLIKERLATEESTGRQAALWALTRMRTDPARTAVRSAFEDTDATVRAIACRSAGMTDDSQAVGRLIAALDDSAPHVRRQAMVALGKLGQPEVVPFLLRRAEGVADRTEEHALIYSLIEIASAEETRSGLSFDAPRARQAALIALDQMSDGNLESSDVLSAIRSPDRQLASGAVNILTRRSDWACDAAGVISEWLDDDDGHLSDDSMRKLLAAFLTTPECVDVVRSALTATDVDLAKRRLVLQSMADGPSFEVDSWVDPLLSLLRGDSSDVSLAAVRAAGKSRSQAIHQALAGIASNREFPEALRLTAIELQPAAGRTLRPAELNLLVTVVKRETPADHVQQACRILAESTLDHEQLSELVELIPRAGPLELGELVKPFRHGRDAALIQRFVDALQHARALATLTPRDLNDLKKSWPKEVSLKLQMVQDELTMLESQRNERLAELEILTRQGRADRGYEVFVSEQAKCSTCHRVGEQGGKVGPDLSAIGRIRRERDLLEAILYPSASFAREYEPYTIATVEGRVFSGLIVRETEHTIEIQQQTGDPVSLRREQIDVLTPSTVSVMPQGLDAILKPEQLSDLVAYLRSLQGALPETAR